MITMFPAVGVFSSLSLWAFGLTPVFPSQAALLHVPHSTVGSLVVRLFIYPNFLLLSPVFTYVTWIAGQPYTSLPLGSLVLQETKLL